MQSDSDYDCVYTAYVRTGSVLKGGTDSKIGLKLYDKYGYYIYIKNIEAWGGLMGKGYSYFERGNLDIFSGRGPCLDGPVCAVNVTSDGSGSNVCSVHTIVVVVALHHIYWISSLVVRHKLTRSLKLGMMIFCYELVVGEDRVLTDLTVTAMLSENRRRRDRDSVAGAIFASKW